MIVWGGDVTVGLDQFLDELRATPRTWFLIHDFIRADIRTAVAKDLCCPVSALLQAEAKEFLRVAETVGLDEGLAMRIAMAADGSRGHDAALRARLLDACGLSSERHASE